MSNNNDNNITCINAFGFSFSCASFCFKKCNVIKLNRANLLSSSLNVSLTEKDAWNGFISGISNLVDSNLIIVLTKCDKIHSMTVKLCSIDICDDENIKLYVKYPIYGKKNKCNNKCKIKCDRCIKVCGKVPTTYDIPNYEISHNNICVNNYANVNYDDLKNTTYKNVKFYYDDTYNYHPCFVSV